MKALPPAWQRKVVEEESKKAKGKWLVRISNIPTKPPTVLKVMMEQYLATSLDKVEITPNGAVLSCPNAHSQQLVLGLTGHSLDGKVVKCSRTDSVLSCDQLCDFISDKLETDMKLQSLRATWDNSPQPKDIQQVEKGKGASQPSKQPKQAAFSSGGKAASQGKPTPPQSPTNKFQKYANQGKGQGKGNNKPKGPPGKSGKGSSQGPSYTESKFQPLTCEYCQLQGKPGPHGHTKDQCYHWQKDQLILKEAKFCLTCQKAGRPFTHEYTQCQWVLANRERFQHQRSGNHQAGSWNQQHSQRPPSPRNSPHRNTADQWQNQPQAPRDQRPPSPKSSHPGATSSISSNPTTQSR